MKLFRILQITMLALPAVAHAQSWNFGVEAGYVHNDLAVEQYKAKGRNGFKVGADAELTLPNRITFESGLAFIRKGGETSGKDMFGSEVTAVKFAEMNYLQIPLMAGYKVVIGPGLRIKPQVGCYYAVGVGGHSFVSGSDPFGQPYETRVSTFAGADRVSYRPCNRNDFGLSFGLNFSYRHFMIKAEYDLGLLNATYYGNGKQRTLSVGVAYWLR